MANTFPQAKFLQKSEASKYLQNNDEFISSLNDFNIKLRLKDEKVNSNNFTEFLGLQCLEWTQDEITAIQRDFDKLIVALDDLNFQVVYPPQILFIKTTGKEEFSGPHTRQNAIILPEGKLHFALLTHEFFHILSRNNPDLKESLYEIAGFCPLKSIQKELSIEINKLVIINPDAPKNDFFIHVQVNNTIKEVVPILLSNFSADELKKETSLQEIISFKLFDINSSLIFNITGTDYIQRIRANTGYNIHPEEILAEHFVYLIYQTLGLPITQAPKFQDSIFELKSKLQNLKH